MSDHALTTTSRPEPVLLMDAVKALVAVLVSLGWLQLDSVQVNLVITLAGALITVVLSIVTRRWVTPMSDPIAADGSMMVPISAVIDDDGGLRD